jgi:predicted DNA-binding transcriptional regulator AlpA
MKKSAPHSSVPALSATPSLTQSTIKRRARRASSRVAAAPANPSVPQYITEEQLASMTTLSRSGLQAMRARGEGPAYARLGHRIVYRLAEVERWIEARTRRGENGL